MRYIAGIDIGNSSTEVALATLSATGELSFVSSALAETTGIKGTLRNVHGIQEALAQATKKVGINVSDISLIRINEATPVIGDVAMETITETIITESTMIGHNPKTPGGVGLGVGLTITPQELLTRPADTPYILVVSSAFDFADIATMINASVRAGYQLTGVILQRDDGVLVNNRLEIPLPIVDEVLYSILADAHPHIGTDKLPRVIENIREQIKRCGGEVHFETRMDAFIMKENEVIGIETNTGKSFYGPVILATGHSARDVYNYLYERQIQIEAKGIAVGVRLEHPQELIDQIQYHRKEGRGKYLPAAEYSFVTQANNRGVYSFCMCPGGFVVPAASGPKQVVVNGMSPSNRGSRWSNSGMVVEIRPEDYSELVGQEELYLRNGEKVDADSPLALMAFQERLEEVCWLNGGMKQTAPAQRMDDFMRKKNSFDLYIDKGKLIFLLDSYLQKLFQEY